MTAVLVSLVAFMFTLLGGLFALKFSDNLHRILGFTAGVLLAVVAFDILPEIFASLQNLHLDPVWPMIALVVGFLVFHILEKTILMHNAQEEDYGSHTHHHPHVGKLSALALAAHSFLDGVGIGLGFQVNPKVGVAVAIAVIAHDFSDGLNTVALMLLHKNKRKAALRMLFLDASAPVLGALSTTVIHVSERGLLIYLGFFAGFLLYIATSEILPEAHSKHSSYKTIMLTVLGAVFMFTVTRFI
ncbi:MAG: ZIP family metal transporter [Candidatus Saccharimonadales bacterium]